MYQLKLKLDKFINDTICGKNTCFSMGGHHPPKYKKLRKKTEMVKTWCVQQNIKWF